MVYADIEAQKKQVQNELAQKKLSYNQSLAMQKQETDNTINKNKTYLDEQIKKMNTDRIVNDDKITALNNRRGGFYSGGLDYQLSENLKNTTAGQNGLRRDTGVNNQEILNKYNLVASQAAEQIRLLENESGDKIRALVNEALARQQAEAQAAAKERERAARASRARATASSTSPSDAELARLYQEYLASKGQPTNFFMTPNEATKRAVNVYEGMNSRAGRAVAKASKAPATNTKMTANEKRRRGL
ncbi:MAG: hypothetical protein K0S80_3649 [Neobacillus sp.]|nr:hypothetical protein [Neobacillus sp.]